MDKHVVSWWLVLVSGAVNSLSLAATSVHQVRSPKSVHES